MHLKFDKTRAEATPKEWLRLGAQIGEQVNTWSGRSDVVAYVGPGAGGPSPACFNPPLAEIEINVEVAFGEKTKPTWIGDFTTRRTHYDYPKAAGATLHEAMHAKHSLMDIAALKTYEDWRVAMVAEMLEETRIESRGVLAWPKNRVFLRACALDIVLSDMDLEETEKQGVIGVSRLMLLSLARVDAGVLEEEDVEEIRELAEKIFGDDLVEEMRDIWVRGQAHAVDTDHEVLINLGKEWIQLLINNGMISEDPTDDMPEMPEELKALFKAMAEAMEEAAEGSAMGAMDEAAEQERREMWEEVAKSRDAVAKEKTAHKDAMSKIFAKGTGPSSTTSTASVLKEKRPPTSAERVAAVRLSKMLEKARYQDRVVTPVKSIQPPGRLRTNVAMQGAAEKRVNGMTSQAPWRRNKRTHVEDPELKIGMLTDISGSMGGAMLPMAVMGWAFSEAARRADAQCASIYYGSGVFSVLKPGQHLREVHVYTAPDGTERFNLAFKALDGALNLLHGSGARLLVISSDMCYTGDEGAHARTWIKRLIDAGCGVMILPFDGGYHAKDYKKTGATILSGVTDPTGAIAEIGKAAVDAIESANSRLNGAR